MSKLSNYKIIIQARSGSTRLPDKMNLPFYKEQTILDIILKNLLEKFSKDQIILATTTNSKDDLIVKRGNKYGVCVFRGNENNVLNRFIEAATNFNAVNIIRVCADNPFIKNEYIEQLINEFENNQCDYLSFNTHDNTPSIKTHYGFFAELTTLETLIDVSEQTEDALYMEHVTNYIYSNPDKYKLEFISIPKFIEEANIRLTVDTLDDFNVCKEIYAYLVNNGIDINPKNIIKFICENPHLNELMINQINLNKK